MLPCISLNRYFQAHVRLPVEAEDPQRGRKMRRDGKERGVRQLDAQRQLELLQHTTAPRHLRREMDRERKREGKGSGFRFKFGSIWESSRKGVPSTETHPRPQGESERNKARKAQCVALFAPSQFRRVDASEHLCSPHVTCEG